MQNDPGDIISEDTSQRIILVSYYLLYLELGCGGSIFNVVLDYDR